VRREPLEGVFSSCYDKLPMKRGCLWYQMCLPRVRGRRHLLTYRPYVRTFLPPLDLEAEAERVWIVVAEMPPLQGRPDWSWCGKALAVTVCGAVLRLSAARLSG